MAFQIVQTLRFEKVDYKYDRAQDVLDISFGPPIAAIAIQVEDWLAIRVGLQPPALQGITIVGFKKIFEQINPYAEKELPRRIKRLARVEVSLAYDDGSDTVVMRFEEKPFVFLKFLRKLISGGAAPPSIFEPLVRRADSTGRVGASDDALDNVYVEKRLPTNELVGIKILQYTKCGPAAVEEIFGAIVDALFEPSFEHDENVQLITAALFQRLDWQKFATLAA